jgi:hypothetical protein
MATSTYPSLTIANDTTTTNLRFNTLKVGNTNIINDRNHITFLSVSTSIQSIIRPLSYGTISLASPTISLQPTPWNSGVSYATYDVVIHEGVYYIARFPSTGTSPTETAPITLFGFTNTQGYVYWYAGADVLTPFSSNSSFVFTTTSTTNTTYRITPRISSVSTGSNAITITPTSQITFSPTINPTTITFTRPFTTIQTPFTSQNYTRYTILSFSVPSTNSGFFDTTTTGSVSVGFTFGSESWYFTLQNNPSTYYLNNGAVLVPPAPAAATIVAGDTFYIIYNGTQMRFYRQALGGTSTLLYTATTISTSFAVFAQNSIIVDGTTIYTLSNLSATTFPTATATFDTADPNTYNYIAIN